MREALNCISGHSGLWTGDQKMFSYRGETFGLSKWTASNKQLNYHCFISL